MAQQQKQHLGTPEQHKKMRELLDSGYIWNKVRSLCTAGVIIEDPKSNDFYFFGLDGEIMHNPEGYTITV